MNNKKYYDYSQIHGFCETLASRLRGTNFDSVVGVSRGGLIPATIIAESMNVRQLRTVGVRSYQLNGIGKRSKSILYQSCSPYLTGNVLVIDDISDTGETFKFLLDHFSKNQQINKIITCSLFVRRSTSFIPDYYHTDIIGNEWIVFPWETDPTS
jgi:hypoxanthine phosphoribosyltransferase